MPGPVALVGAGEFLAPMVEFDRGLLDATGRTRPRVVILIRLLLFQNSGLYYKGNSVFCARENRSRAAKGRRRRRLG